MADPFYANGWATLYRQDARQIPLPDGSVHCVVTSPPYYLLRRYKDVDETCIGNEACPEAYIENLMQVMREIKRVLRQDGILWVNLRDTWAGTGGRDMENANLHLHRGQGERDIGPSPVLAGRKQGSLFGVPEMFTLAMVGEGWIHRDTVIWDKSVVKPESVHGTMWVRHRINMKARDPAGEDVAFKTRAGGDLGSGKYDAQWEDCRGCPRCAPNDGLVLQMGSWRTTSKHELVLMFTQRMGYWSDGIAVRTPSAGRDSGNLERKYPADRDGDLGNGHLATSVPWDDNGWANRRSVWSDINAHPLADHVHFATFPPDLPRLCIQASTSEKGCCPECGAGWARVVEKKPSTMNIRVRDAKGGRTDEKWGDSAPASALEIASYKDDEELGHTSTIGWRPTCRCGRDDSVPALVLDPFCGTGTTLLAAQRLGRRSVGLDLSGRYLEYAVKRLGAETIPMPLWGQ